MLTTTLLQQMGLLYAEYHEAKDAMKKMNLAKRNVEMFFEIPLEKEGRTTEQNRSK